MIVVEVQYNLAIPEIDFTCPFCKTTQRQTGGRMIDTQLYPNPKDVVQGHLQGDHRCGKFDRRVDSSEELQISGVSVTA